MRARGLAAWSAVRSQEGLSPAVSVALGGGAWVLVLRKGLRGWGGLSPAEESSVGDLAGRFACAGVLAVGFGALRVFGRLELSFRAFAAMKGFTALAGFLAVTLFGCGDSCNEEDLTKSRGRREAEERLVLRFGCVGGKGGFGAEAFPRAWLAGSSRQRCLLSRLCGDCIREGLATSRGA